MVYRHEVPGKAEHYHMRDDSEATTSELGDAGLGGYARFEARKIQQQKIRPGSIVEVRYLERNQTMRVCFVDYKGQVAGLNCVEVLIEADLFRELEGKAAGALTYQVRNETVIILDVDNLHLSSSDTE